MATIGLAPVSATSAQLQDRISKIYDHLYANSVVRTPAAIASEVGKVLHVAMFIEQAQGRVPAFDLPRSFEREARDGAGGRFSALVSEVRTGFQKMNSAWDLYSADDAIVLSDLDIAWTCFQLSGLHISDSGRDVFGDALEIFRSTWTKRAGGQFFTDPQVTQLGIALMDFRPEAGESLLDPAAGTGGFLLAGINRIRQGFAAASESGAHEHRLAEVAEGQLRGVEIDSEVAAAANGTLVARIGSAGSRIVRVADSIRGFALRESAVAHDLKEGSQDCIATNPPFGTKITIKDSRVLSEFVLARPQGGQAVLFSGAEKLSPRAPDILFLELCVRALKPRTGRLAIVLPYQLLSGPQAAYVREWLLKQCKVLASVDLPPDTFQPHTGTRTSILVLLRRDKPLKDLSRVGEERIFMAMPKHIGHDRRGNPVYRRDERGRESDEILTDVPRVLDAYLAFTSEASLERYPESFAISLGDVAADPLKRLNALFYRPSTVAKASGISSKRPTVRFRPMGELVERVFFPTRFKRDYVSAADGGVPFLGGSNITELIHTSAKFLRSTDPRLGELRVEEGWILVTRSGTTGIVSRVPAAWHGLALSEHVIRIVPRPDEISPHYLEAFLRSAVGQEELSRGVFGSVIPEITPEYISELQVPVPTSTKAYQSIVDAFEEAHKARDVAISRLTDGVRQIEQILVSGAS